MEVEKLKLDPALHQSFQEQFPSIDPKDLRQIYPLSSTGTYFQHWNLTGPIYVLHWVGKIEYWSQYTKLEKSNGMEPFLHESFRERWKLNPNDYVWTAPIMNDTGKYYKHKNGTGSIYVWYWNQYGDKEKGGYWKLLPGLNIPNRQKSHQDPLNRYMVETFDTLKI